MFKISHDKNKLHPKKHTSSCTIVYEISISLSLTAQSTHSTMMHRQSWSTSKAMDTLKVQSKNPSLFLYVLKICFFPNMLNIDHGSKVNNTLYLMY